jgi:hypothetical protein
MTSIASGKCSFKAAADEIGMGDQHACSAQSAIESVVGVNFAPPIEDPVQVASEFCEA